MDKLIELLPLPSVLLNWPHPTNHVAIRDYARACVAHATTAQAAEIEALRAEVERLKVVAHGFVDEIALKDRRAERLAEALREAEKDLRQLSVIDCGCKPCRRACRTGKGAEWELESRMKTAHAAANKARAALHPTAAQENGRE